MVLEVVCGGSMKVGDLVKCEFNDDDIGIIIKKGYRLYHVWINDKIITFFRAQLEVINESR